MTFKQFLSKCKGTHDARGDFIRLALADGELPEANNWDEMRSYLASRYGDEEFVNAGAEIWKAYRKSVWRKKNVK